MLDGSELKPGQVIVYRTDYTARDSIAVALLLKTPWTHMSLVVEGGPEPLLLNTYPATDASLVSARGMLAGRQYTVLDLPDADEGWRERVARQARALVGREYWLSPCSRLTALAFLRAGVALFTGRLGRRHHAGWFLPHEFFSKTRLRPVFSTPCARP